MIANSTEACPMFICVTCNRSFERTAVDKSHKRTRKYCSRECRHVDVKKNGITISRTLAQRLAHSQGQRNWWANATPEERDSRSRGIRAHSKTEEHRENMRKHRFVGTRLGRPDKKTIKASVSPTIADLHWAAGFIEGDGSFQPNRKSSMLTVAQVNREPLTKLQKLFGGSIKKTIRQKVNQSDFYVWFIAGSRSRGVMMTLYVLLSARRQTQVDKALGFVEV